MFNALTLLLTCSGFLAPGITTEMLGFLMYQAITIWATVASYFSEIGRISSIPSMIFSKVAPWKSGSS